ncbi:ATP-binding protein [Methylobacterium sp. DB1607]|nr:ATP-binding protein [Methylobacterium sp. DB1607]
MIVSFRFKNFRSFEERAELSMIAHRADKMLPSALIDGSKYAGVRANLLPVSAIYGANAAGKTNVIRAIGYMQRAIEDSQASWSLDGGTSLEQFGREEIEGNNSVFELDFVMEDVRFTYGIAANPQFFEEEWLHYFPKGRRRSLFRRETKSVNGKNVTSVDFGEDFSGSKQYLASIASRIRGNSLFISAAAQDNHELATKISKWFQKNVTLIYGDDNERTYAMATAEVMANRKSVVFDPLMLIMKTADSSIDDIIVTESSLPTSMLEVLPDRQRHQLNERYRHRIVFVHKSGDRKLRLPFEVQSKGIQKLYSVCMRILFARYLGEVLLFDEIESSIHPHLARFIVDLFQNRELALPPAQLIFTTHDATMLDQNLLRRDQIWFVEKSECSSHLYSLLEFSPRKDENIQAGYLRGRYGAIPLLGLSEDWLNMSNISVSDER